MGKKVFISYKYSDRNVKALPNCEETTARQYVDKLMNLIGEDHIYKGEKDGEFLEDFTNDEIKSLLRDKIYDSTVTLVLISPNMKEEEKQEKDQWIPWEISYSLKEATRNERTSRRNGILAIVLPDINDSYTYYFEKKTCCNSGCILNKISILFEILRKNMFNKKEPDCYECDNKDKIYKENEHSYIKVIKWCDFIKDTNKHIEECAELIDKCDDYNLTLQQK